MTRRGCWTLLGKKHAVIHFQRFLDTNSDGVYQILKLNGVMISLLDRPFHDISLKDGRFFVSLKPCEMQWFMAVAYLLVEVYVREIKLKLFFKVCVFFFDVAPQKETCSPRFTASNHHSKSFVVDQISGSFEQKMWIGGKSKNRSSNRPENL